MTGSAPRARPRASVVIPAFNRLDLLRPVLEAFSSHRAREPFEVVVVDDGSDPPVAPLVEAIGGPGAIRVVRQPVNRGRAAAVNAGVAAAAGEIVIVCDSDVLPGDGFVDEHVAFHRDHPGPLQTHLGALEWGVDPGPLGELLGPRANPRLSGMTGPVDWTLWYTDNWSFERGLLGEGDRFDEGFRSWGWEDLELAWRLRSRGATSRITGAAVGRHLKPVTLDGMLRNFARSVPNLLRLACLVGPGPEVSGWLAFRIQDPGLLRAAGEILERIVARAEALCPRLRTADHLPAALVRQLGVDVSNAIFALGMERGFAAIPDLAAIGAPALPPADDVEMVLRYGNAVATLLLLGAALGDGPSSDRFAAGIVQTLAAAGGGALVDAFADRIRACAESVVIAHAAGAPRAA